MEEIIQTVRLSTPLSTSKYHDDRRICRKVERLLSRIGFQMQSEINSQYIGAPTCRKNSFKESSSVLIVGMSSHVSL